MAYKDNWEFTTGKAGGEGRKGTLIKVMAYQDRPYIYSGALTQAEQPESES